MAYHMAVYYYALDLMVRFYIEQLDDHSNPKPV